MSTIGCFEIHADEPERAVGRRPVPVGGAGTNAFVCSMLVDDFDAVAAAVQDAGGRMALPTFAVPGRCWQGCFLDQEGNTFGVLQLDGSAA